MPLSAVCQQPLLGGAANTNESKTKRKGLVLLSFVLRASRTATVQKVTSS